MNRKGISFTLTLVVIGVVLLMTALTVIVLGGGEIGGFLQRGGGAATGASVQQACNNLAEKVDNNYCSWYARLPSSGGNADCAQVQRRSTGPYEVLATNVPCDFMSQANSGSDTTARTNLRAVLKNEGRLVNPENQERGYDINNDGDQNFRPVVTVGGTIYDCIQEGHMDQLCPAGR